MKVRAAARSLEKGVQGDLIKQVEGVRAIIGGRNWQDHGLTWAAVKPPHYNTYLEEILASMGENGEREITWDVDRLTSPRAHWHSLQGMQRSSMYTRRGWILRYTR